MEVTPPRSREAVEGVFVDGAGGAPRNAAGQSLNSLATLENATELKVPVRSDVRTVAPPQRRLARACASALPATDFTAFGVPGFPRSFAAFFATFGLVTFRLLDRPRPRDPRAMATGSFRATAYTSLWRASTTIPAHDSRLCQHASSLSIPWGQPIKALRQVPMTWTMLRRLGGLDIGYQRIIHFCGIFFRRPTSKVEVQFLTWVYTIGVRQVV